MILRFYDSLTMGLLALAGAVMFGLSIGNALLRYFFSAPLTWGEEISRYAMVWGVLIGVAVAYRCGQHVAITLITEVLPRKAILPVRILSHVLALVTAFVLFWSGRVLTDSLGMIFAPSSDIPMSWVFVAFPVCAVMLAFEALRLLITDLLPAKTTGDAP